MKKKLLTLTALLCCVVGLGAITACKDKGNKPASSSSSSSAEVEDTFAFDWKIVMPNGVEYQNVTAIPTLSLYERCNIKVAEAGATFVSETPTVATVSDLGVVSVISAGEAKITVTVGKDKQTITFIANDAGNVPVITFNASNVLEDENGFYCNVMQGRTLNTGAGLKYNGINYTDVTLTFASSDEDVATFENGKIQGKKEGTATLTVSANGWRGYVGANLSQTITVNVRPDLSLNVAKDSVELWATKLTDEETSFALAPTVAINSVAVENPTFVYSGYDESIVTVDETGLIQAVGEGETEVKIKYTTAGGAYIEKTVNVKIALPVENTSLVFQLDKSQGVAFERDSFDMDGAEKFKRVEDVATGKKAALDADGVCTAGAIPSGERELVVYTNKQGYKVQATVVDKVIMSGAELLSMATDYGATADWFTYEGYFVLGRDIDLTGTTVSTAGDTFKGGGAFNGLGFSGTFDGKGHTISGAKFGLGGLFGRLENATVKNFAITGAILEGVASSCIAYQVNNSKIDNVFIDYKQNGSPLSSAALIAYANTGASELTNILFHIRSMVSNETNAVGSLFATVNSMPSKIENVYVITGGMEVSEYFTYTQNPETKVVTPHFADFADVYTYTSVDGFKDAGHALTGFNEYWDKTGDYPTFKVKEKEVLAKTYTVELGVNENVVLENPASGKVLAVEIGGARIADYTVQNGEITLPYTAFANLPVGDYALTIDAEDKTYQVGVAIVTKVIDSATELKALATTENLTGYYVLGADLTDVGNFAGLTTGTFSGIFDGRGFTVSGALFDMGGGLLGATASNAIVRNLAIVNSSFLGSTAGAIAKALTGTNTVENVFIALNKPSTAWTNAVGVIAYSVTGTLTVNNAVCYIADAYAPSATATATFVSWTTESKTVVTCTNVYVGSNTGLSYVNTNTGTINGVQSYATLSAMQADYKAGKWNVSAFENLGFKSAFVDFMSK